jgi:hypothetical protein
MKAYRRVRKPNDPVSIWERGNDWRKISQAVRRRNPICQAIENTQQCTSPAELVHHIISPEDRWDLRADWKNLVAICYRHHGPETGDAGRFEYVPTIGFFDGEIFPHTGVKPLFESHAPTDQAMAKLMADVSADEIYESLKRFP